MLPLLLAGWSGHKLAPAHARTHKHNVSFTLACSAGGGVGADRAINILGCSIGLCWSPTPAVRHASFVLSCFCALHVCVIVLATSVFCHEGGTQPTLDVTCVARAQTCHHQTAPACPLAAYCERGRCQHVVCMAQVPGALPTAAGNSSPRQPRSFGLNRSSHDSFGELGGD